MSKYRHNLPQTTGRMFITDGGIETTLIFHHGLELPEFAAFVLLENEAGIQTLQRYYQDYANIARQYKVGLILDSPTWRANQAWGSKIGYSEEALAQINRRAIDLMRDIRDSIETDTTIGVIGGVIGPQADGYVPSAMLTVEEATAYHLPQIQTLAQTEADMVTALTMNYVEEAIGVALAARACNMPVAISFTVETDGKLPTGDTLRDAIERTDAATDAYPIYYMINCAHPEHFQHSLTLEGGWVSRIRGLRANASKKSHAELNEATELDDGNPVELGAQYRALKSQLSQLTVLGGCCGTDHRHIEEICKSYLA